LNAPRQLDHLSPAEQLCAAGERLYRRQLVAANEGNLSLRLDPLRILCTPTLICKGLMRPHDLCCVDLDARHVSGARRPTSEIRLHLELYRNNPHTNAVVHAHPPHATAFGLLGQELPTGILPEAELFLGRVPVVPYHTPGTPQFAEQIRPHAQDCCAALLANHGAVTWADTLERALWWMEALDGYCRVLLLAAAAGPIQRLTPEQARALLRLRPAFGSPADPRAESADDGALFVNRTFGSEQR
jgi:L-fuculose-phosphate aldolase